MRRAASLAWRALAVPLAVLPFLAAAPAPAPATSPPADLTEVEGQIAVVRALAFRQPVASRALGAKEAAALLGEDLDRDIPPGTEPALTRLLAELELLPFGYPLRDKMRDLLFEQVVGFYSTRTKQLVVVDIPKGHPAESLGPQMRPVVLGHELAHALADQHFDLGRLIDDPALAHRDDLLFARHALAEGDATLAMLLLALHRAGIATGGAPLPDGPGLRTLIEQLGSGQFPALAGAPPWVREQLVEPYLLGLELVVGAYKRGGWDAVNALWRTPPDSSRALLHPEAPAPVPSPPAAPALAAGEASAARMELGELGLRLLLGAHGPKAEAEAAAAGWRGDRVDLVEGGPQGARVVLAATFDDVAAADRFAAALERWARASKRDEIDGGEAWRLGQSGRTVTLELRAGAARAPVRYEERKEKVDQLAPDWDFPEVK